MTRGRLDRTLRLDPVPPDQMAAFQEIRDRALALLPGWQSQRDAPVAANTQ